MSVIESLLVITTILSSTQVATPATIQEYTAPETQILTSATSSIPIPLESPLAEEVAGPGPANLPASPVAATGSVPVPPPVGVPLVDAALSQLGINQDCTDLVQNSLAALGYTTRRDQGGFDFGVDDVAYTFGVQVPVSEAQPGDIATFGPGNGGHVWIILDPATNTGIHGGWNGTTAIGVSQTPLAAHTVYRVI